VELTRRPYTIEGFSGLLGQAKALGLPGSILHQILPGLRCGFHDRQIFRWRLGKHQRALFDALEESQDGAGMSASPRASRWCRERRPDGAWCRHTDVVDVALLAQEDRRMAQETANE